MTNRLAFLLLACGSGCLSTPDGPPAGSPDAAPPQVDAAPPSPPDAAPVQAVCVTSEFEAMDRWYGCSTIDMWTGCGMDTLYNQQVDGGERCYDCHTAAGADGHASGGVLLSQDTELTYMSYRDPPGMYKFAVPVSGPSGYEGLEMNDIMIEKGTINNDGHPNYEWDQERLDAMNCYMGQMMDQFVNCSNACANQ